MDMLFSFGEYIIQRLREAMRIYPRNFVLLHRVWTDAVDFV